ncbi:MAG: hypothetical protein AAGD25_32020 [Cyanobacteria bacterium P01_F01_bin.150]
MKYIKSDQKKSTIVFIGNEITLVDRIIEKSIFLVEGEKFNGSISIFLDELQEISTYLKIEQEEVYPDLRLDLDLRQLSILVEITAEAIHSNQEVYTELVPYCKDMKIINSSIREVIDTMIKDKLSVKVIKEAIEIGKQAQIEAEKIGKNLNKDQIREECILKLENYNLAFLLFDHSKYSRNVWAGIQIAFLDNDHNLIAKSPVRIIDTIDIKSIIAYFFQSIQILSNKDKL